MFMNSHSEHMRLYHGSNQVVEKPVILEPNRRMDFGRGFYTTQSVVQAEKWAKTVHNREETGTPIVSEYEYTESEEVSVLRFDGPTNEWFDFVEFNRTEDSSHDYDIVIGPVADEGVFTVLYRFETGLITKEQAIQQLESAKLDGQILFHTDLSLGCLRFVRH